MLEVLLPQYILPKIAMAWVPHKGRYF